MLVCIATFSQASSFVSIGTGSMTGLYYPTGTHIAKIVNQRKRSTDIRLAVESTTGSVYNINQVQSGDLALGLAQSDLLYQAVSSQQKQGQNELRTICSFHREAITLLAGEHAQISTLMDIKGKTLSLGPHGSAARSNALDVVQAVSMQPQKDFKDVALTTAEALKQIKAKQIDGFFVTVGHPSPVVAEATSALHKLNFVPLSPLGTLLETHKYYAATTIPIQFYPMALNQIDIVTIGVTATLITSQAIADDVIYQITKALFENLEEFKSLHPAYQELNPQNMLTGLSAPLHAGAARYFRQKGLLKEL